jgi:hypothetical protein
MIKIGKDWGVMGLRCYWFIEINGKVIMHGFKRKKDAKSYLKSLRE